MGKRPLLFCCCVVLHVSFTCSLPHLTTALSLPLALCHTFALTPSGRIGSGEDPDDDPHWRLFKEGGKVSGGGEGGGLKPVPPPPFPRKRGPRQRRGVLIQPALRRQRVRRSVQIGATEMVATSNNPHSTPETDDHVFAHSTSCLLRES